MYVLESYVGSGPSTSGIRLHAQNRFGRETRCVPALACSSLLSLTERHPVAHSHCLLFLVSSGPAPTTISSCKSDESHRLHHASTGDT